MAQLQGLQAQETPSSNPDFLYAKYRVLYHSVGGQIVQHAKSVAELEHIMSSFDILCLYLEFEGETHGCVP